MIFILYHKSENKMIFFFSNARNRGLIDECVSETAFYINTKNSQILFPLLLDC